MRILWVTIDRSNRIASIFDPLRVEVSKIADVDVIMRKLHVVAGTYQNLCLGGFQDEKLIDPKKLKNYSHIMVDAPFAFMNEEWEKVKGPIKMALFEDQHGPNPIYSRKLQECGFSIFFCRYRNGFLKRHSHLGRSKILWLPHSIDDNVFYDYKLKKEIETLMIGRVHEKIYPVRWMITQTLKDKEYFKKIGRPGETFDKKSEKWPVGIDYAKLINSAKITFSCLSSLQYPVLKFFEIPGSNSCLFSDYNNELKNLGFIPDTNMVQIKNEKDVIEKVEYYLKNGVDEISRNGYDLIHSKHTAKIRAKEFLEYIK
jgi:hypothetical protein